MDKDATERLQREILVDASQLHCPDLHGPPQVTANGGIDGGFSMPETPAVRDRPQWVDTRLAATGNPVTVARRPAEVQ